MEPIETINLKGGYRVEVHIDESPESPRDWDNIGTIYSNHRRYNFDGHRIEDLIEDVGGNIHESVIPWEKIAKKYYYQKVWMYDHSGVTVRTGESNPWGSGWMAWDSGLAGVIVCEKTKAMKEFGYKRPCKSLREKVEKCLDGEIDTLDKCLRGEVYGFIIFDNEDNEIDSCWGFYDIDDAISDGKDIAEYDYKLKNGGDLFEGQVEAQAVECE